VVGVPFVTFSVVGMIGVPWSRSFRCVGTAFLLLIPLVRWLVVLCGVHDAISPAALLLGAPILWRWFDREGLVCGVGLFGFGRVGVRGRGCRYVII